MRKLFTILIVSLFALSLFAASGTASTTLYLNAEVAGKLFHGFTSSSLTSADAVKSAVSGDESGDDSVSGLNLESDSAQAIGYYNLYTTGSAQAVVKLTTTPLSVTLDETTYYVPYSLTYSGTSGNSTVTVSGSSIGDADTASTVNPGSSEATTVLTTTGNGLRWQTLSLSATFDGDGNTSFGLPESDSYTGTIVAAVTAN